MQPELWYPVVVISALAFAVSTSGSLLLSALATRLRRFGRPLLARGVELIGALPTVLLLAGAELSSRLPSQLTFGLVLGLVQALRLTRVLRIELVKLETHPELLAARALGVTGATLLNDHLLPRFASHFLVNAATLPAQVVSLQAGMALFGFDRGRPSWGRLLVEPSEQRWPALVAIAVGTALLLLGARRLDAQLRKSRGAQRSPD